ncbi:MAG: DNA mismatch repair endonuclease MutL [Candidatus Marinimicrobia bacterium]|nr:DNA mismatch repair endonuclease MutL [Candidatus Neomarinimicrobiota bacterium]MBT3936201.1 DNA mismatch repair endonuclease MutL [Candidatus Neomarinimicrobiota bacterium]MBT3960639.1 DNA mismatch repair endonuclease MutL [Candidatus Neomarinimicrobiota bacterium]MBT4384102.1 DNA mismatch repair endonuclease MutL [Candidatus Neomarinimicrobiota bacterium]MBT4635330.1 DNA mismatch repair endonuclease MutL [Candidatus Neomarinimicrobiota bacterium]
MIIQPLSEDLRNKISAGEVVERPASVVKECVENSLDAGATDISIIIKKGGHHLIHVSDNGSGMSSEDLTASVLRYHTSKIESIDDLFSIDTLGFRGEALASIASVAEMKIVSSHGQKVGHEITVENGVSNSVAPAPAIGGTEITIQNLFFNTPARKKFLKAPRTEMRKVVDIVRRYGLAYPEVAFKIISDEKEILSVLPESLEERIDALFDPTYGENLRPVNFSKGDFVFTGFVGNLNLIRSRPSEQYLFLNRRFIKDRLLNSAVYSAYEALVKRGEYPFFVINLMIPSDQVDVNVHPMKTEVRFQDEWRVYHVLKSGVKEALKELLDTLPSFDKPFDSFFQKSNNYEGDSNQGSIQFSNTPLSQNEKEYQTLQRAKSYASQLAESREDSSTSFATENIWQIHNKYILSEISSGLVMIDQHVAHERVLYEEALIAFESTSMASQTLLFPEKLDFSADEFDALLDVLPYLEKIGFKVKKEGDSSIRVEAIPSEMGWGMEKSVIRDIIDHFLNHRKEYSSFQEGLAASFACKAAIKAGDPMTKEEMQELVNRLFATNHPYYCPHGRPIIVQMSLDELDRRFERH